MDPRIQNHAEILVEYCTEVQPGDTVLIKAVSQAEDLVVALQKELGERGALPTVSWLNQRASRAYTRAMDSEDFQTMDHVLAEMKTTDVVIMISGLSNAAELSDVDPEKRAAASKAKQPILEERLTKRWVITKHPTPADAQRAELSTAAWSDLLYDAMTIDWEEQRQRQDRVKDVLDTASDIRIETSGQTDLRMSVDGMGVLNDTGKENMPGGEVATSPVINSVEGTVAIDFPFRENGREVAGAILEFSNGEVVDFSAETNERVLKSLLETDEGARRLGELGIGMNPGIDQLTHNMLIDEKRGGTIHIALGEALEECVPEELEFNTSARHVDLLVEMGEGSSITVDGDRIQQDGRFWFEKNDAP